MNVEGIFKGMINGNMVVVKKEKYNSGNIALQAYCLSEFEFEDEKEYYIETYATLTVNLTGLQKDELAIDVNNVPGALDFLEKLGVVCVLNKLIGSGYCSYPVVRIEGEFLSKENFILELEDIYAI